MNSALNKSKPPHGLKARQLWRARFIHDKLKDYLPAEYLDFGCGNGAITYQGRELGYQAYGVDVDANLLFSIPMVVYDGKRLPFADNAYEGAIALFVLHHTPDVEASLAELARVTKQRLIIIEDVWENWWQKFFLYFFHHLFDLFMLILNKLRFTSWKVSAKLNFRDENGWIQTFERMGLKVAKVIPLTFLSWIPIRHKVFIVDVDG